MYYIYVWCAQRLGAAALAPSLLDSIMGIPMGIDRELRGSA